MRVYFLITLLLLCLVVKAYAVPVLQDLNYILLAPPKTQDASSMYQWLNILYQRWNVLQVATQQPNGNIDADYGQQIIYDKNGTYYLAIQTTDPHGTTWVGVQMGSI